MANLSALLSATISVTDTTLTPNVTIVTRNYNNPTLTATTVFYDPFIQIGTSATVLTLPAATIFIVYVKNLSSAANILLNWTPNGGSAVNVGVIAPGGVFTHFMATETAGTAISSITNGITAVSLTASASATSAEVMLAA